MGRISIEFSLHNTGNCCGISIAICWLFKCMFTNAAGSSLAYKIMRMCRIGVAKPVCCIPSDRAAINDEIKEVRRVSTLSSCFNFKHSNWGNYEETFLPKSWNYHNLQRQINLQTRISLRCERSLEHQSHRENVQPPYRQHLRSGSYPNLYQLCHCSALTSYHRLCQLNLLLGNNYEKHFVERKLQIVVLQIVVIIKNNREEQCQAGIWDMKYAVWLNPSLRLLFPGSRRFAS